jgi:acyl-CoA thioester hydrolase
MRPDGFAFSTELRARFAETDAQGVVYHANFFIYCEVARTEYFRALVAAGVDEHAWREAGRAYDLVLAHASCDFRSSAHYDELLTIWTRVSRVGSSSFTFEYKILAGERLVGEAQTVQVAIAKDTRRPAALPDAFRQRIDAFEKRVL